MKKLPYRFWLVTLVFALVTTLACSFSNNLTPTVASTDTASITTDEPNAISTGHPAGPTAKPGTKVTAPAKPQTIQDKTTTPAAAVDDQSVEMNPKIASLDNYRVLLKITAKGKNDQGADINETFSSLEEMNKGASSTHLNNSDSAVTDTTDVTNTDIYVIKDLVYMVDSSSDQPTCAVYNTSEESIEGLGGIRPGQMFTKVDKDTLVKGGETVNGILTDHYSAMNIAMSLGEPTSISGDVWIAKDGQYIVHFSGQADGTFLLNANVINGSITWDYNVTDLGKVGDMEAPTVCADEKPQIIDFPIPKNATVDQNDPDFIAFESPDDASVVIDFLNKELPGKGWTITKPSTETDGAFIIGIKKADKNMEITVIPEDPSGCSVIVNSPDE